MSTDLSIQWCQQQAELRAILAKMLDTLEQVDSAQLPDRTTLANDILKLAKLTMVDIVKQLNHEESTE